MTLSTKNAADHLPLTTVTFEILLALAAGERHGYDILQSIEDRTGGHLRLNPGTLDRALDRLVGQDLLRSHERPRSGGAGDGPRRFFALTALGKEVAAAEAERLADQVRAARRAHVLGRATGK